MSDAEELREVIRQALGLLSEGQRYVALDLLRTAASAPAGSVHLALPRAPREVVRVDDVSDALRRWTWSTPQASVLLYAGTVTRDGERVRPQVRWVVSCSASAEKRGLFAATEDAAAACRSAALDLLALADVVGAFNPEMDERQMPLLGEEVPRG